MTKLSLKKNCPSLIEFSTCQLISVSNILFVEVVFSCFFYTWQHCIMYKLRGLPHLHVSAHLQVSLKYSWTYGEYTKYPQSQVVQNVRRRTRGMTELEAVPQWGPFSPAELLHVWTSTSDHGEMLMKITEHLETVLCSRPSSWKDIIEEQRSRFLSFLSMAVVSTMTKATWLGKELFFLHVCIAVHHWWDLWQELKKCKNLKTGPEAYFSELFPLACSACLQS